MVKNNVALFIDDPLPETQMFISRLLYLRLCHLKDDTNTNLELSEKVKSFMIILKQWKGGMWEGWTKLKLKHYWLCVSDIWTNLILFYGFDCRLKFILTIGPAASKNTYHSTIVTIINTFFYLYYDFSGFDLHRKLLQIYK